MLSEQWLRSSTATTGAIGSFICGPLLVKANSSEIKYWYQCSTDTDSATHGSHHTMLSFKQQTVERSTWAHEARLTSSWSSSSKVSRMRETRRLVVLFLRSSRGSSFVLKRGPLQLLQGALRTLYDPFSLVSIPIAAIQCSLQRARRDLYVILWVTATITQAFSFILILS